MKTRSVKTVGLAVAGACLTTVLGASNVYASSVPVSCASFGPLPAATFNPSGANTGIPNGSVCQATFAGIGDDIITIGLEAHARYENAPVTDNGAGIYFADPGANFGDPTFATAPSATLGATWNHAFYVSVTNGVLSDYNIQFLYEVDPAAANDSANFGSLNLNAFNAAFGSSLSTYQDSENLNFAFLCGPPVPGAVTPPASGCPFNPLISGVYSAALTVSSAAGAPLGSVSTQVNVGIQAVPEPASMMLLGSGVVGLIARRRSRQRKH